MLLLVVRLLASHAGPDRLAGLDARVPRRHDLFGDTAGPDLGAGRPEPGDWVVLNFLRLGIICATLSVRPAEHRPGACDGLAVGGWQETAPNLLDFPFITLTTVACGAVRPAAPLAHFCALVEAIIGQL
jgi:hypothetical protein